MPRFMNKNQVFLVSTREDVVLFCNDVLHKYTTVKRIYDFSGVSHNTEGIIIYDACKEAETLSFLVNAHKFTCPFIIFISPLLNEDIQRALRLFTNFCFSSITNMVTKRSFADFAERFFAACNEGGSSNAHVCALQNHTEIKNETINGLFAGVSPLIRNFRASIRSVSTVDTPVFLLGETGCGKTVAARLIHDLSVRKKGPFIPVPISEFASSINESTFFGKTEGAYTDAKYDIGYFKQVDHGSLFLDEIGTCRIHQQEKLLRFADEKTFTPVGSSKPVKVDTRIILATNANIKEMIQKGTMRLDFFHRFDNNVLTIPPLRDRPEDIPYIAKQYLKDNKIKKFLTSTAMERLCEFNWTGNIRDLHHCLDRTTLACAKERIDSDDLDFGYLA